MRKILFTIVWVASFSITLLKSQPFRKLYDVQKLGGNSLVEFQNGTIFMPIGQISKISPNGNFSIGINTASNGGYLYQAIKINNQSMIAVGSFNDSCVDPVENFPFISYLDTNFNFTNGRHYRSYGLCRLGSNGIERLESNNYLTYGRGYKWGSIPINPFALLVDNTLDSVIFCKYFSRKGNCVFGKQLPDGNIMLGANFDSIGACVIKLDSIGNILWCKSIVRPTGIFLSAVVNNDGTLMITGIDDYLDWNFAFNGPYPANYHPQLFIMKMDTGGTVLWCKGYSSTFKGQWIAGQPAPIIKTFDDNFVFAALKITDKTYLPNTGAYVKLLKVDANGDTIYTRGYGAPSGRDTYLGNLIQSKDTGYLITGNFEGKPFSFGGSYLFKTDTGGYTPCGGMYDEPLNMTPLFFTDSLMSLSSIDGADVLPAFATPLFSTSVITADDCIVLANPTTSPQSLYSWPYPNPTKGEVNIQKSNNVPLSYITVYNHQGILVLQKKLEQDEEGKIDLSKFGPGLYLIKINEQGKIRTEQVVVE
ncbi:MAG TPA: T9SS type A sorting domain-containing protein [Bacteroidia bacterium]|nr:T9SS type A sorting domain-containing protein [Bacteroidia bacterium]